MKKSNYRYFSSGFTHAVLISTLAMIKLRNPICFLSNLSFYHSVSLCPLMHAAQGAGGTVII